MQRNETNTKKANGFERIWQSLSLNERRELRTELLAKKLCTTDATVYNWAAGKCAPQNPFIRKEIAKIVSRRIFRDVTADELFS